MRFTWTVIFAWAWATAAPAQPVGRASNNRSPLSLYAPTTAGFFLHLRRLSETDRALARAGVSQIVARVAGVNAGADEFSPLSAALVDLLGPDHPIDRSELNNREAAVMAPSPTALQHSVWLLRVANRSSVDRWFPKSRRTAEVTTADTKTFRTSDGLIVSVRGDVMALARRWPDDRLLVDCIGVMRGAASPVLGESARYQTLKSRLPANALAVAFIDVATAPSGKSQRSQHMVALYEGGGRLDLAIRSVGTADRRPGAISPRTIDRLFSLPRTTLAATTLAIDPRSIAEVGQSNEEQVHAVSASPNASNGSTGGVTNAEASAGVLARYLRFAQALRAAYKVAPTAPLPPIGPHAIAIWDQDLRVGRESPQFAMMIECESPEAMAWEVEATVESIRELIRAVDADGAAEAIEVREYLHLGIPISYVGLSTYGEVSRFPVTRVLSPVELAWAPWQDWIIVAMSRGHLERIVDAQRGLFPTVSALPDLRVPLGAGGTVTTLSIAQPSLAAGVLDRWVSHPSTGHPTLLDSDWWQRLGELGRSPHQRLGIGMRTVQSPGVVVVSRVYPGTAAEGLLKPGDRIIGVDGELLQLTEPNADLRRHWLEQPNQGAVIVRVERDGKALDVELKRDEQTVGLPPLPVDPKIAMQELIPVGRSVSLISLASLREDDGSYSTRVSLRLKQPRTAHRAPPNPRPQAD